MLIELQQVDALPTPPGVIDRVELELPPRGPSMLAALGLKGVVTEADEAAVYVRALRVPLAAL